MAGLHAAEKEKRPRLSKKNIKERLEFAKRYKDYTIDDWKRVIWSDETKINRFNSDGRSWCWKSDGESLQDHHVKQTVKYGGGSLMIWGCMSWNGPGLMTRIIGKLNKERYVSILEDYLLRSIDYCGMEKHTSGMAKDWIRRQPFAVITDWPAQSPDLNPIEHLWAHIKRRLNQYDTPPKGILMLWERVEKEWALITPETCQNLIESVPRRLNAVIRAKGKWTKY